MYMYYDRPGSLNSDVMFLLDFQILRLVCKSCGKPCRSKEEQELHSKRNPGHNEFVDETSKQGEISYSGDAAPPAAASSGLFCLTVYFVISHMIIAPNLDPQKPTMKSISTKNTSMLQFSFFLQPRYL
jgi:hypothetical protein